MVPDLLKNEYTENLSFAPEAISANKIEGSFLIYGKKGILVGNFPKYVGYTRKLESNQTPIQCELIEPFLYEDEVSSTVTQAEFSFLDTSYVFALIRKTHKE